MEGGEHGLRSRRPPPGSAPRLRPGNTCAEPAVYALLVEHFPNEGPDADVPEGFYCAAHANAAKKANPGSRLELLPKNTSGDDEPDAVEP